MLIERLNAELDRLKVPAERRDICLIWDEVNLTGQVARPNPNPNPNPDPNPNPNPNPDPDPDPYP